MKRKLLLLFFCGLMYGMASFSQHLKPGEGYVKVNGGRIWYKIVGNGKGIPLLLIHGGPGSRSCEGIAGYSLLGDDRPVIFYDQLGSGKSDRPTDTTLWQLPRFVDEIEQLRSALHLKELHILGSSWGAAVLVEYMLTKKPKGVKSVNFSGPLLSTPLWMEDAKILLSQLPKNLQDTIQKYEALREYRAPSYLAATDSFYARFMSVKEWPEVIPSTCDGVPGFNEQVYNYMWGPTEFTATGTLKGFDRTDRLHEIKEPVVFMAGRYDETRLETIYAFQKLVPRSTVMIIENAGHLKIIDQPVQFTNAIRSFLQSVETRK
ncbi:proline iminopeptidase-family hydrolase [Flavihumibacter fluvii]|uniref:proline iminopeptidase-family hydrolase n=1 Tax=Flavihumibacter fluvii TaxID=2838157 RepID=UPI001BDDF073|nr:proline iminopeptidase-family hydrolase [Flavihumibacter fluvii]ULQ54686.1 proline iminopeptidase-family hydrolase [Flavihumibacter fluvii]